MNRKLIKQYSMNFGKKEKVLNYACQTYQLSRPNKVGAVMALIRECQPQTIEEWRKWYFENAKITEVVIPEWREAFTQLTKEDCIDYVAKICDKAIGIQIKPVTAKANFGSYSLTERINSIIANLHKM